MATRWTGCSAVARLFIIRHGNTFDRGDTVLRVGGRTDLPLSQSGRAQAHDLARHFAKLRLGACRLLTSPLKRTLETAQAIADGLDAGPRPPQPPLTLRIDPRLREIDYGPDEGKPEADVVARIGQAALDAWEARSAVPPGWRVDPDALTAMWRALLAEAAAAPEPMLVVTSNGIARFALGLVLRDAALGAKLRTGAYGAIDLSGPAPRLTEWDVRPPPD
ncbi:MAG: histidine phosphatase family protein [Pseudomonadota bacterium]